VGEIPREFKSRPRRHLSKVTNFIIIISYPYFLTIKYKGKAPSKKELDELQESGFPNLKVKDKAYKKCKALSFIGYLLFLTIKEIPSNAQITSAEFSRLYYKQKLKFTDVLPAPIINDFTIDMVTRYPIVRNLGAYDEKTDIYSKGVKPKTPIPSFRKPPTKKIPKKTIPKSRFDKINTNIVIVDGTNVCRHPELKDPSVRNLELMINELKSQGKEVTVLLAHFYKNKNTWDDKNKLKKLIKDKEITLVTSELDDDFWFISFAIKQNALLVTNDKLRDWKEKNPEQALDIDNRRVSYMIQQDTVILGEPLGVINN
tara:strand:+ start:832 stop:1776 length:945 start_codon:yes stop_codon:yes gene_type:complete